MDQLLDAADTIDLLLEKETLRCSKGTLTQHSDYFKVMFQGNFKEKSMSVIRLEDIDVHALRAILKLIDDAETEIEQEDLIGILKTACLLQFLQVKQAVIERINRSLSVANCIKVWLASELLNIELLRLRAKSVAMLHFNYVKDGDAIYGLTLDELCCFLGNTQLQCSTEMDVFDTGMRWFYEYHSDLNHFDTIIRILHCINFNDLQEHDLVTMMSYPHISGQHRIVRILEGVLCRKRSRHTFPKDDQELSCRLYNSRGRTLQKFPCILLDRIPKQNNGFKRSTCILYYNIKAGRFSLLADAADKCDNMEGYKMIGYKDYVYFYGGERMLGTGNWNYNLWSYDSFCNSWRLNVNKTIPNPRRHFESCVCGNSLYIIGGTSKYRIIQEDMHRYDIAKGEWFGPVQLPCLSRGVKCCCHNGKLLLLSIDNFNALAYIYNVESNSFVTYMIYDRANLVPAYNSSDYVLFSYKGSIYEKGEYLIRMDFVDNELHVTHCCPIQNKKSSQRDITLCDNVLYTLYREVECDSLVFEGFCMETFKTEYIFKDEEWACKLIDEPIITGDYDYKIPILTFGVHHYNLVDKDTFVNDFPS